MRTSSALHWYKTYRPNLNLPINSHRPILDPISPKHSRLRQIDNRCAK